MTTGTWTQNDLPNLPTAACGGSVRPTRSRTKTWSGTDRSSASDLSPHPYTMSFEEVVYGIVAHSWDPSRLRGPLVNCYGGGNMPFPPEDSNLELKVLSKLAEKIRMGGDFNLGVFLGTQHQSLRLIFDSATKVRMGLMTLAGGGGVRSVVKALQTGRVHRTGSTRRNIKDLSATWLEASYGWLPLLDDVRGAAQQMAVGRDAFSKRIVQARAVATNETPSPDSSLVVEGFAKRRIQIIYTIEEATSWSEQLAISGLNDPWSIGWELLPYSFVCDWFIPVGSFLENIALFSNLKGSWVKTTSTVREVKVTLKPSVWVTERPHTYRQVSVARTVGATPLSVPLPSFKSPISSDWRRTANAVALLVGKIF